MLVMIQSRWLAGWIEPRAAEGVEDLKRMEVSVSIPDVTPSSR